MSPVSIAHSPHAISFLHPAAGSQLKAGASPPQDQRFVRGEARARGARRMSRRADLDGILRVGGEVVCVG